MSDNTRIDNGTTGDTIRDKDRTGVKTQIVGLDINPNGSEVLGTGDGTNGLDVDVTRVQGSVTVAQGTATNLKVDASGAAVPVTDNSGSLTVDAPLTTPVATRLSDGTSAIGATSQRLHVDDGGSSLSVDDNSGSLTMDAPVGTPVFVRLSDGTSAIATLPVSLASLPALAAGTNAIGKLAANSGVDIGDVDVTSVPTDPFGATADAAVAAGASGSISAKLRRISQGLEDLKTNVVLAAGTAAIGKLAANSGVDIGSVGHNVTGIGDGRKTVTTAGTRVTLASSTAAKQVTLTALSGNTGVIVVGGTACVAALGTRRGTPLNAGDSMGPIPVDDLNDINLDATVNGDGVSFTYLT